MEKPTESVGGREGGGRTALRRTSSEKGENKIHVVQAWNIPRKRAFGHRPSTSYAGFTVGLNKASKHHVVADSVWPPGDWDFKGKAHRSQSRV